MGEKYAAIDLGASSGRVIVGEIAGGSLSLAEVHRFPNGPVKSGDSLFWDIDGLFREIKTGLKKACAAATLSGIAIDTWGVDYALLGKKGFVRPPYHYRDARTTPMPEKLFAQIPPEELYARSGIQFMALNTIYQLLAHQLSHPADLDGTTMLMVPDALTYMLSGHVGAEYTEASTSQLIDPATGGWNFELIDQIGLPRGIFPAISPPCSAAGTIREELRKELGCGAVPVFKIGSHDTASAVAAVPAETGAGDWAYLSCGTWSLLGAELDRPVVSEAARQAGFTNEGGLNGKIRFLSNINGLWIIQECRRLWNENGKDYSFSDLEKLARTAAPQTFLINPNNPRFFAPENMLTEIRKSCEENDQGKIVDDAAVARCVLDSLALCYRDKLDTMASLLNKRFQRLHVVGGGCKNSLLMRLTCDCAGVPVTAGPDEATAIGNLIGQAIASGEIPSLAAGRDIVRRSSLTKEFIPDKAAAAQWEQSFKKFKKLP